MTLTIVSIVILVLVGAGLLFYDRIFIKRFWEKVQFMQRELSAVRSLLVDQAKLPKPSYGPSHVEVSFDTIGLIDNTGVDMNTQTELELKYALPGLPETTKRYEAKDKTDMEFDLTRLEEKGARVEVTRVIRVTEYESPAVNPA